LIFYLILLFCHQIRSFGYKTNNSKTYLPLFWSWTAFWINHFFAWMFDFRCQIMNQRVFFPFFCCEIWNFVFVNSNKCWQHYNHIFLLLLLLLVSISPTFYTCLFCTKVFFETFLYFQFVFVFFNARIVSNKLLGKFWWNWLEVSISPAFSYKSILWSFQFVFVFFLPKGYWQIKCWWNWLLISSSQPGLHVPIGVHRKPQGTGKPTFH